MNLITAYRKALKDLKKSYKDEASTVKQADKDKNEITYHYRDKIHALEVERDNAIRVIEENIEQHKIQYKADREASIATYKQVNTILKLMAITKDPDIQNGSPEVYFYSDKDENGNYIHPKRKVTIEPITTLREDRYSVIKLYIVPNGKPTNKYSLVIRGYHIFRELIKDTFKGNINRVNENHCNLKDVVKEATTEKELLEYANNPKNLSKIMALLPIEELNNIREQYDEAITLLKDKEWQILYYENIKDYYENHYSQGTETTEYAAVLLALKQLRKQ
jgi:hypothetical protein